MAVQNINIENVLNQPNLAKVVWLSYYRENNPLQISDYDIGRIESAYEDLIPQWKQSTAMDENVYNFEFELDEWNDAVAEGEEQAKALTGYEATGGQKAGQITRCATDGAIALYTGSVAAANAGSAIGSITGKVAGTVGEKTTEQAGSSIAGEAFFFVSAALDVANAAWYLIDKPNEEASQAVNVLANDMGNQQSATMNAQNDLVTMDEELQTAADDAYFVNEDANTYMGEQKTMYDFYASTMRYFDAAKTAGYHFNSRDLQLYSECIAYMTSISQDIDVTQQTTTETVAEVSENMSTYEAGFDEVIDTAATVQGVTDYAQSFDEATQTMTQVESYSQTVSAGAAGVDAARGAYLAATSGAAWWMVLLYGAAAVACAGAAVLDGKAASEQKQMSEAAGAEVALRAQTQDMNTATQELYETGIEYYAAYTETVDGLTTEVPDGVVIPEMTPLPPESTPENNQNDGDGDDEDDKKDKKGRA